MLTVTILFDWNAGPNLISKDSLPPARKESVPSVQSATPNREPQSSEHRRHRSIVHSQWHPGVCTRFGIVETLSLHVLLQRSLIQKCICSIIQTELKVVPWHLGPVAAIETKTTISSITPDNTLFHVDTHSQDDASSDVSKLYRLLVM